MLSRTLVIILSFCGIMLLTPMSAAESLKDYLKVISTTRIEILNMSTRLDGQDLDLAQGAREILAARESETTHVVDLEEIDVEVSEPLPKATITNKLKFRRTMLKSSCQIDINNLHFYSLRAKSAELISRLKAAESATRASCRILQTSEH